MTDPRSAAIAARAIEAVEADARYVIEAPMKIEIRKVDPLPREASRGPGTVLNLGKAKKRGSAAGLAGWGPERNPYCDPNLKAAWEGYRAAAYERSSGDGNSTI